MSFNKNNISQFIEQFEKAKKLRDIKELNAILSDIALKYRDFMGVGDLFVAYGEQLICANDYEKGILWIKTAANNFTQISNITTLYLRLAEVEFKSGNIEEGKKYLLLLCRKIDNYEESIKFNGLTEVWSLYKSYVADQIPDSIAFNTSPAIPPESCTKQIGEILSLPRDILLDELSEHLNELCGNGEALDVLSKQELNAYLIDEFIVNINSDGIEHYLYYSGTHFTLLKAALEEIKVDKALILLEKIRKKLPRCAIPKNEEKWQSALERIEDQGKDFESEEDFYYQEVEGCLLAALCDYVLKNAQYFK